MNREEKQESSVPAQSRVSIVTLAQLAKYWQDEEYSIRTVSQLIAWSLDLLKEILITNKHIKGEPSIEEARSYMMREKLFQQGTLTRGRNKLDAAVRFEGIRKRGYDPRSNDYDKTVYSRLHRSPNKITGEPSSVEPFMDGVSNSDDGTPIINKAMETYNKILSGEIETKPILTREYELRNTPIEDIEPLKKRATSEEVADHMKKVEQKANEQLGALNSIDLDALSSTAISEEKSV